MQFAPEHKSFWWQVAWGLLSLRLTSTGFRSMGQPFLSLELLVVHAPRHHWSAQCCDQPGKPRESFNSQSGLFGQREFSHVQAKPQSKTTVRRVLARLGICPQPNSTVKRTPILASKYGYPPCFALRCRLPRALGLIKEKPKLFAQIVFITLFFYPLWGFALLLSMCSRMRPRGHLGARIVGSLAVASLATLVFAPVMWGGEGFGMMLPWYLALLFGSKHAIASWQLVAFVFALALAITLYPSQKGPPKS